MKVMLVDDSTTMRRIQENQLNSLGVSEIAHAENGREAISKLSEFLPDVVLLDWNMPVMDGLECLKQIRSNADYSAIKVIMCTSESEKSRVLEALKTGATNYIVKPFTPDALKEKLGL